ncbi:sugar transporter, putative [Talaromyces stipitatus ATCC 10500]|uniref:Sugar transporter, putative n=1 Tax=Talaromyces stipitatus (strain ATCC 10500 / CBS 375.48 / QM 6759 / NRRL 1006) TaxID=441959 RepID=B8MQG0_TALSN|nr:sugar transporter, putative [Talaromyces stipitatus ATCC 10500]EED13362.1 sugar transporter, putative [Talaromyces stipitatus ATCC 10500]
MSPSIHAKLLATNSAAIDHVEVSKAAATGWENARLTTEEEHRLTALDAIRKHYKACLWSMVISLTIVMDGYDGALLGSLVAFPSFKSHFGHFVNAKSGYQIAAHWQLALGCSSSVGNIVGIYLGAITTDRLGYKRSLLVWLTWLTGCIFISFFATHISVVFTGELLCGMSWGAFATMAPPYAAEVCPVVLRGLLEIWIVICWGIGQLLSYSVLLTLNTDTSNWAWRIPFAVQWVWPVIIFPLVIFAPESPWWLVRKGKIEAAEKVVKRLGSADITDEMVHRTVATMVETNNLEKSVHEGAGYLDCFQGRNLWRTEISCVAWAAQLWCGFVISAYSTYFFELAGLAATNAYKMSVGQGGLHILFNIIAIPIVAKVGRRRLYLAGFLWMGLILLLIGFVALSPPHTAVGYAQSTLYLLWFCGYQLTVGPVAYILVSEVSSTRLRSKTVALSRNAYNLSLLVNYFAGPYILNPTEGNWKGKTGFLTGGINIILFIWTYFRLPETQGRTFVELDILFEKKELGTKDFKSYVVDFTELSERKIPATEHEA